MSRRSQSIKTGKALRHLNNLDNLNKRAERTHACCNGRKQPGREYRPRNRNDNFDNVSKESKENVKTARKISEVVRSKGKLQRHSTKKQLTTRRNNLSSVSSASSCSSSSRSALSESSTSASSLSSSFSSSTSCDYYSSDEYTNESDEDITESDEVTTETDDDSHCQCNRK